MRHRTAHTCVARIIRFNRHRVWFTLGLLLLAPLTGCAAGDAELFINDVKNFYLNGGLSSMESEETSLSESDGAGESISALQIESEDSACVAPRKDGGERGQSFPSQAGSRTER